MKNRGQRSGFTIVELLIVVVVIAILAAITIVSYNGITNKANDSVVSSDVASSAKKAELYKINNGYYPKPSDFATDPNTQAALNSVTVATRGAYWTASNAYLYCYSEAGVAFMARSKSGAGFYSGTYGSGVFEWVSDANASLCPLAGVETTSTGYGNAWFYSGNPGSGYKWQDWFIG